MGYIIKSPTGGGGGDATSANQQIQIQQLDNAGGSSSVFKDPASDVSVFQDNSNNSVFKNISDRSTFKENSGDSVFSTSAVQSVFKKNDASIFERSKITSPSTIVQSFQNTTPALLAADIQLFLNGSSFAIISIVYADAGGIAPNPHTALVICNAI
jgi:hypothetical protein